MDSSPDYTRATSNFDEKKENSPGGSECDETVSLSSSTQGSAVNGLPGPYRDMGIKNRTNKKKTLKNFRNLKTFRRRARSRAVDQISKDMSDDIVTPQLKSSLEVTDETPHYMKATSSSKGKKANSLESQQNSEFCFDNTDRTSSHSSQSNVASPSVRSLQTSSTALNLRNMKILIKTTSFKPKRSSLKYSQVSQDVHVDRATCSSTLKDSKFAKSVVHIPGEIESEKISGMKVCRYHHCSLHGHCNEAHDPVPPQKRLLYKKRRSLKKQKSAKPKSDSKSVTKSSRDKNKDLHRGQMISNLQQLVQGESDSIATSYEGDTSISCALEVKMSETPCLSASNVVDSGTEINTKPKTQLVGDGYSSIQESDLVEIAFGETSNPEENYRESLNRVMDYGTQEQGILCLKCSSIKMEPNESKRTADVDLPRPQVLDSNLGNGYKATDFSDTYASSISLNADEQFSADGKITATSNGAECDFNAPNIQNALTPDHFDEVTESNSVMSSTSDDQTSKYGNPESERKFTTEVMHAEDSESSEVTHVKNSEVSTRFHEENKTRFNKVRHISMWHMIHQHMAESIAAESENKPLQDDDGSNVLPAKESSASSRDFSDSDRGILNNDYELEDIEVRKLFAVKLVREAIEKILLPEVQDQTSDDQSITSDSTHEQELFEKEHEGSVQESSTECKPDKGEGDAPADLKEEGLNNTDISGQEIVETDKKFGSKSEKKAPKHWSNLKKWILLQRFIKELEKVRKLNPRSPQHLPLKPDPESEKVNLRPQTVEERKKAEEWMLDYALRQAVSQLAPTQKRKVSLLIKAFETVVTPNEDNSQKIAGITYEVGESVLKENSTNKEAREIFELKSDNGETALEHNLQGIREDTVVCLNSEFPTGNFLPTIGNIETQEPDYGSGESKNLILDGNGLSSEDTISSAVHCGTLELEAKVRGEANQEVVPELRGFQEGTISDSRESETKNVSHNIQLERQNYIRMWHSIYQHVVSGIAEKVGSQFLEGTDDDEVEDGNELPKISKGDFFLKSDDDSVKENHVSSYLNSAFTKSDAVKLVQEAVDEILLPEIQDDSSDAQSVTSDFKPDQEISESLNQENETQCITCEGGISVDQEDWKMKSARRPEPLKSKNWSKLKKLILLKRSLKALEKARKLNLQPPRQLSVMPDPKQEKADLRHQMMDERKKAEQWMLDYAVQHIVTKLTPARKRRVSMLVEAFEAVVPLPELLTP